MKLALVVNPTTLARLPEEKPLEESLALAGDLADVVETTGAGDDLARVERLLGSSRADVVVAAGGDGTVGLVAEALLRTDGPTTLAVLPLGTADNFARSLGLEAIRAGGAAALGRAVEAIRSGRDAEVDAGEVDGRPFVTAFSIGMDASILSTRNRWRQSIDGWGEGYAAYLWSCGRNLLVRQGAEATVVADGDVLRGHAYNVLVANVPIHAGEFRFDSRPVETDGRLDLLVIASAADYVASYTIAWPRHLLGQRGVSLPSARGLRRVREVTIELDQPVPAQADGEEIAARDVYRLRVLPSALRVRIPRD